MQTHGGKRDLSRQNGPGMLGEREKPRAQERKKKKKGMTGGGKMG